MCSTLSFPSKNTGYIFGTSLTSGVLLKTKDAGLTWETLIKPAYSGIASTSFVDSPRGFAAGQNGQIIRTIDYGQNWESVESNTTANLFRLQMIDINNGYALGYDDASRKGVVLRYR